MTTPQSVPLITRRADVRELSARISEHRHDGQRCKPACAELVQMRAEHKAICEELRTWFAPGEDQPTLFDDLAFPCCAHCEHDENCPPHRKPCRGGCND